MAERQVSPGPGKFGKRVDNSILGSLTHFGEFGCRCYAQSVQTGVKPQGELQKELEPLKLPGRLAEYTGNVLYPNEDSSAWDVNGKQRVERERGEGGVRKGAAQSAKLCEYIHMYSMSFMDGLCDPTVKVRLCEMSAYLCKCEAQLLCMLIPCATLSGL